MVGALATSLNQALPSFGDAPALSDPARVLTYRDLIERARAIAQRLRAADLNLNEPVHVYVSNQPADIAALIGVWLANGVAVPIHRATPRAVQSAFEKRSLARFAWDAQGGCSDDDCLLTIADIAPPARILLDGAALIVFTSGSTGVPKGVVVAHDAFRGKIEQIDKLLGFQPGERCLLVLNINFSFGLWLSLLTLLRGGTLVMQSKFIPGHFMCALIDQRITRVGMVPTMMRLLFSDARFVPSIERLQTQASLGQILMGGESLGPSLGALIRARFRTTQLVDIYGLTETSTCDFFAFPADYAAAPGSIGRPSPNVAHRIATPEGVPVEAGATGELQIRSPYLMTGYLDEPELTEAAYQDGWFKTGDLARSADGERVELMGRQKEVISRAGNKVTPFEIEQSVCSHPDVAAAMAVGVDDSLLGQRIHVLLVPRIGASLQLDDVRRHLETRLERFKHPDAYYLGDALPIGRTGKADRTQLKAMIVSGELAPIRN